MIDESSDVLRRYGPMVWRIVYRLVGGIRHADAADCFQEVFVAALEVRRREEVRNWEALLRRLATTKGLDVIRRRVRERGWINKEVAVEALAADEGGVRERIEREDLIAELRGALAELPPEQAEAFCLRHISGMSHGELANELGITVNAASVMLSRATARLRELMKKRYLMDEVRRG